MAFAALKGWTTEQKHVVAASYLGWTLDAFDYFLLVLVLTGIVIRSSRPMVARHRSRRRHDQTFPVQRSGPGRRPALPCRSASPALARRAGHPPGERPVVDELAGQR